MELLLSAEEWGGEGARFVFNILKWEVLCKFSNILLMWKHLLKFFVSYEGGRHTEVWGNLEWFLRMVWVRGDFKDYFSCHVQEHLPLDQFAQSLIQPGHEQFQGLSIHSAPGQPVPIPHQPHSQEFLPNF